VPPWWIAGDIPSWTLIVDKWCSEGWVEMHESCRARRLKMSGPPHHQGNRNLNQYRGAWSAAHGGQPCSEVQGYALSHKGRATSDVTYNPEDGPEAYTNPVAHRRLSDYNAMAREAHGPDFDPATRPIDGTVVMRMGDKQHGRYAIASSSIDRSITPTLSQLRVQSTDSSSAIRPRATATEIQMEQLQILTHVRHPGGQVAGRAGEDAARISKEIGPSDAVRAEYGGGDGFFAATVPYTTTYTPCSYTSF
ncbi:unnamed protein product, partial [Urochloa humidicola]